MGEGPKVVYPTKNFPPTTTTSALSLLIPTTTP